MRKQVTEDVQGVFDLTFVISNDKDIWMNQKTMALLLGTERRTIGYHLNKKFDSGELSKEENMVNPKSANNLGEFPKMPSSTKQPILYNFEAILTVAFSVNSKRAIEVRRWANKTLINALVTDIKL